MTPEERAEKLCRSMWQAHSTAVDLSQDEEVLAIASAICEAIKEERAECAKIVRCAEVGTLMANMIADRIMRRE